MTAEAWEEPIPYALTDRAWLAGKCQLTTAEAAVRAGVTRTYVQQLVLASELDAVKVDRYWLIDAESVDDWLARRQTVAAEPGEHIHPRLPAAPLLRWVELLGGAAALGVEAKSAEEKALERAADEGSLTVWAADHLAVHALRMTPWEVWGEAYDEA